MHCPVSNSNEPPPAWQQMVHTEVEKSDRDVAVVSHSSLVSLSTLGEEKRGDQTLTSSSDEFDGGDGDGDGIGASPELARSQTSISDLQQQGVKVTKLEEKIEKDRVYKSYSAPEKTKDININNNGNNNNNNNNNRKDNKLNFVREEIVNILPEAGEKNNKSKGKTFRVAVKKLMTVI